MLKYETPITVDNWKQAERAAIEIHERASRKKFQSRLIRKTGVFTVALTIVVAVYGILRRVNFNSALFGGYDSMPWLNSIWEAVFGHVWDISELWYIRWPLIAFEVVLIPAAIAGILALITMRKKSYSPPLYKDDPRSRALVLRDVVTCREGFFGQVLVCACICTFLFIVYVAAENIASVGTDTPVLALSYDGKALLRYGVGIVATFAGSALISTLSSLVSRPLYYDNGKPATKMMSDLYDFLHSGAPASDTPEPKEEGDKSPEAGGEN